MPIENLCGQVFGKLVALSEGPRQGARQRITWNCQCICGNSKIVLASNLKSGNVQSCGCLSRDGTLKANYTHGLHGTPIYNVWKNMIARCENPDCDQYKWYGARGISVCSRWHDVTAFAEDMPNRPNGYQIDRIDNDGNYEPGNCRWSARVTQCNNRRTNTNLTFNGETHTIAEWSRITGIKQSTICQRLYRSGWPIERALRP